MKFINNIVWDIYYWLYYHTDSRSERECRLVNWWKMNICWPVNWLYMDKRNKKYIKNYKKYKLLSLRYDK